MYACRDVGSEVYMGVIIRNMRIHCGYVRACVIVIV